MMMTAFSATMAVNLSVAITALSLFMRHAIYLRLLKYREGDGSVWNAVLLKGRKSRAVVRVMLANILIAVSASSVKTKLNLVGSTVLRSRV